MKNIYIALIIVLTTFSGFAQVTIQEARNMELGTTVTVSGIVLNGDEMGIIRYIQDETAGIAAYGSQLSSVKRGDKITITGTLKDYNNLLELDPISAVSVVSSNNTLPDPITMSPSELAEEYEGELVEIRDVIFENGGSTFGGNTSYSFTTNGETASIYIKTGTPLVGEVIPSGKVKLIGICSQYSYNDPATGYQLLLRDANDIQQNSAIYLTSPINADLITRNKIQLSWSTNIEGISYLLYGNTQDFELDPVLVSANSSFHQVSITTLNPSELLYTKALVTNGIDTAYSSTSVFITESESSGDLKVYFNTETEDSVSTGTLAITLDQAIDDTLIQYINRAEISIDLAIYNINNSGLSNMTEALNNAYNRGVNIRIVHDGSTACLGLAELNENINTIASPTTDGYGIMHNKFIIFDAESDDFNDPLVWTGSTNLTRDNINKDGNNVIIIQDKSLAIAYKLEFEEMWGSSTLVPNSNNAKFGPDKTDNTPHEFFIGGKEMEVYFSPSDQTNKHLIEAINSADNDLSVETMLITRSDIAYAIQDANKAGVATNVITNAEADNSTFVNELLRDELKVHFTFSNVSEGTLHHKLMVVDQAAPNSDPLVLTGSHNWSNAANNLNDENTIVIHNAEVANLYYQQFVYNFLENEGSFSEINEPPLAVNDTIATDKNTKATVYVLDNDILASDVTMEIYSHATNGKSEIPFTNPKVIQYDPNLDFIGSDTIEYKIAYKADPTLFSIGKIIITVKNGSTLADFQSLKFEIFPNPNKGFFTLGLSDKSSTSTLVTILDLSGRIIYNETLIQGINKHQISLENSIKKGCYILQIENNGNTQSKKIIVN